MNAASAHTWPSRLGQCSACQTSTAHITRALELTGKDVGTPILVFHPDKPNQASFFGPVISAIPRGPEALRLWDAVETLATTSGMAELKRSLRSAPKFG